MSSDLNVPAPALEPVASAARPSQPKIEVPITATAAASAPVEHLAEHLAERVAVPAATAKVAPEMNAGHVQAPEPDSLPEPGPQLGSEASSEWLKQIQHEYQQMEDKPAKRNQASIWAVLVGLVVVSLAALVYFRIQFAPTPAPTTQSALLAVEAVSRDGHIELHWNPASLGSVKKGVLEIRDAGGPIEMPLDAAALSLGSYAYLSKSDVTAFRLHVDKVDGTTAEGTTTFVAASAPVERSVEKPDEVPPDPLKDPVREVVRESVPTDLKDTSVGKKNPSRLETRPLLEKTPGEKLFEAKKLEEKRLADQRRNEDLARRMPPKPFVPPMQSAAKTAVSTIVVPEVNGLQSQQNQRTPALSSPVLPGPAMAAGVPPPALPLPAPKPVAATPKAPELSGRWAMQPGSYSRSPAVPSAIDISVRETDGAVRGTLEANYKAGSKNEKMSLSFSGKMVNGVARFPYLTKDGKSGHIEFMRVPNSPNSVEVVWYSSDNKQVFNEIVKKAQ